MYKVIEFDFYTPTLKSYLRNGRKERSNRPWAITFICFLIINFNQLQLLFIKNQYFIYRVRTTKYTLLSFLPRNLLEQFHRVANLYFIFIVLLNWVPAINAFGKEIAMIPVLFVLGVTAVKDFFEDRRRLASDRRVNNSMCRVYLR